MATYLQGVSDVFPQQSLFQPDWNFLSTAVGSKQLQYDRSLNQIRNYRNSLLNAPITNGENAEARERYFKSMEQQLRTVTGLDLSRPENSQKALEIFNPLLEDRELIHDMSVTKAIQSELTKAEGIRNSSDAAIRATYNPISIEDIKYARQDLAMARRGDGSILSTQSRQYVDGIDTFKILGDLAGKEGLKIKTETRVGDGTILVVQNGEGAVKPFSEWAKSVLSQPQYQAYFDSLGRVSHRRNVNAMMSMGMSKMDAEMSIASSLHESQIDSKLKEADFNSKKLDEIHFQKKRIEALVGKNKATDQDKQLLNQLIQAEEDLTVNSKRLDQEITELQTDGPERLIPVLDRLYSENALNSISYGWGRNEAMKNSQVEYKTDDALLKQWDLQFKYTELDFNRQKMLFEAEQDFKLAGYQSQLRREEAAQKAAFDFELEKLKGAGKGTGKGSSENAFVLNSVGSYTGEAQTGTPLDVQLNRVNNAERNLYDAAFSYGDGVLSNLNLPSDKYDKFSNVSAKLQDMLTTPGMKMSDADKQNLYEFFQYLDMGKEVSGIPNTPEGARIALQKLSSGLYRKGNHYAGLDGSSNSKQANKGMSNALTQMLSNMGDMLTAIDDYKSFEQEAIKLIQADPDLAETLQEQGAITTINGRSFYDFSKLKTDQKEYFSKMLKGKGFDESTGISGVIYKAENINTNDLTTIVRPNLVKSIRVNGEDNTKDYLEGDADNLLRDISGLGGESLIELFGEEFEVFNDPANNQLVFNLYLKPESTVASKLPSLEEKTRNIQIAIGYNDVANNQWLSSRYGSIVSESMRRDQPLGLLSHFQSGGVENRYQALSLPAHISYSTNFKNLKVREVKTKGGGRGVALEGQYLLPNGITTTVENMVWPIDTSNENYSLYNIEKQIHNFIQKTEAEQRAKAAEIQRARQLQ